ncbi:hypothetical protein [Sneathiella limimaris]|uniref:hypothetical protein n=1 Tax=Sneathiella limimaris TaxID=1964213 RepID=UPI00146A65C4|nr:hypothetical protein [Sneathiella limimaris]
MNAKLRKYTALGIGMMMLAGCSTVQSTKSTGSVASEVVETSGYKISSDKSQLLKTVAVTNENQSVFVNDPLFGGAVNAVVLRSYVSGNLQNCKMFEVKSGAETNSSQTFYSCQSGKVWKLIGRQYRN